MRIKDGFILRQMAGSTVVIPSGTDLDLNMMITLNDTGRFLWERMQTETDVDTLTAEVLEVYDIDEESARGYIEKFAAKLKELDFLA